MKAEKELQKEKEQEKEQNKEQDKKQEKEKDKAKAKHLRWLIPLFLVVAGITIFLLVNPLSVRLALNGPEEVTVEYGSEFTDPGATASFGGTVFLKDLASPEVSTSGEVDVHRLGDCQLEYSASFLWSSATVSRTVHVVDTVPPEITLEGDEAIKLYTGTPYVEPGYHATDNCDGDLAERVTVSGQVDSYRVGVYELTYTVEDSCHNAASVKRTVTVVAKPQAQQVSPGDKVVYLTFDDGPGPHTARLLDMLDKYNVKATFFVVGTGNVNLIAEEAARGHSVGIHSASHAYKQIYASEEAYFADLQKMSDIILAQTGKATTLLRFPGGSSNTVSNFNPGIMTRLAQDVTNMGYQYFDWNVSSGDAGGVYTSEAVAQNVINGIKRHNVSVVLQHDTKGFSVDAVEKIITWGLANGYTFLPLSASSPTAHHGISN